MKLLPLFAFCVVSTLVVSQASASSGHEYTIQCTNEDQDFHSDILKVVVLNSSVTGFVYFNGDKWTTISNCRKAKKNLNCSTADGKITLSADSDLQVVLSLGTENKTNFNCMRD